MALNELIHLSEKILKSNCTVKGPDYLLSDQKRKFDQILARLLAPAAALCVAIGTKAVQQENPSAPRICQIDFKHPITKRYTRKRKIRSMVYNADEILEILLKRGQTYTDLKKSGLDPRITATGRILRKLSIDETPQILDALNGHIALIGPRQPDLSDWEKGILPHSEVAPFRNYIQLTSLGIRYGITSLPAVLGRSELAFSERIALEVKYMQEATLVADFRIALRTVTAVLSRKGAR